MRSSSTAALAYSKESGGSVSVVHELSTFFQPRWVMDVNVVATGSASWVSSVERTGVQTPDCSSLKRWNISTRWHRR